MLNSNSRRVFLRKTALLASGLTLLPSSTLLQAMPLNECPFDGYLPGEIWNNDLRKFQENVPNVRVSGTVYDALGLLPKPNTIMELWHLSPNSEKYAHRGKTLTDANGSYTFITDFPNNEAGRAARLYLKIGTSSSCYFTELIINDFGAHITSAHWERNNILQSKMYPQLKLGENQYEVTFNMTL